MAIFKPEVTSNKPFTSFLGVCEFGILEFTDKSGDFDWCDLFLEMKVKQKDSDYERTMQIKGSYDKEGGKITGGSCLKRLYQFFDEIGCGAGINVDGGWEDPEGNEIKDIAKYLNDNFIKGSSDYEPSMDYIGYFYREHPKTPGAKSYTRMWNKIYRNSEDNKTKLQEDANWMKSKGYIKEMKDTDVVPNSGGNTLSGSGLANL